MISQKNTLRFPLYTAQQHRRGTLSIRLIAGMCRLGLLALWGCREDIEPGYRTIEYWPLNQGDSKTFLQVTAFGDVRRVTETVQGAEVIKGVEVSKVLFRDGMKYSAQAAGVSGVREYQELHPA